MREYWGSGYSGTGGGGGGGGGASWLLTGNAGTNPVLNFVGTSDAQDLVLRANNVERMLLIWNASIRFSDSAGNFILFLDDYDALVQSNVRIRASGPIANVALVLESSGNGPTLANRPDGGGGGNARGIYATDFQKSRGAASQVAGGDYSGILSGQNNEISATSSHALLAGGVANTVTNAVGSVLVGGSNNSVTGADAFLGGGNGNTVADMGSFLGGGTSNTIAAPAQYSTLVGGANNTINTDVYQFLGGGQLNSTASPYAALVGGTNNSVGGSSDRSFVGGGTGNLILTGVDSSIVGGAGNQIGPAATADASFIGGGDSNSIDDGAYGVIGGGQSNSIGGGALTRYASVVGGTSNIIGGASSGSTIAGGSSNGVFAGVTYGAILGGQSNTVTTDAYYGAALGGYWSSSTHYAEASHAAGIGISGNPNFFASGGAQHSWVVWRNRIPATGVATELFLDGNEGAIVGSPFRFNLQVNNDTYQFEIQVAAKDTVNVGQAAWWKVVGGVYRDGAGTTALIGAPTVTTQNTGGLSAGWLLSVTANAADDTLRISLTIPVIVGAAPVAAVASGHMTRSRFA